MVDSFSAFLQYVLLEVCMLNKVELIGRVGGDPDQRFMPNGTAVVNLTMATSRRYKSKQTGEKVEEAEWHRVVCFGKLAEIIAEYVKKGRLIRIEGRLKTRQWEKDGVKRYSTEIIADDMLMLGSRAEAQGQSAGPSSGQSMPSPEVPAASLDDFDDVPF